MIRRDGDKDKTSPDQPTTFHQLAQAGLELEGSGRFAPDARVVGSTPNAGSVYPAASAAQSDPVPPEEPLGESVEDMIPVGTPSEIAISLVERIERERRSE